MSRTMYYLLLLLSLPMSPEAHDQMESTDSERAVPSQTTHPSSSLHFSLKQGPSDRVLSIPDLLPTGQHTVTLTHC